MLCSQAVTHPSTNRAQHCLTSVIELELVCSMCYGCFLLGELIMKPWHQLKCILYAVELVVRSIIDKGRSDLFEGIVPQ